MCGMKDVASIGGKELREKKENCLRPTNFTTTHGSCREIALTEHTFHSLLRCFKHKLISFFRDYLVD